MCPYIKSSDGAKQFISNYALNSIEIDTGRDVYYKVFGNFDMKGSLKKGFGTIAELHYFKDNTQYDTDKFDNINLQNLGGHAVIEVVGMSEVKGTLQLNCNPLFNPTVPTL